MLARLGQQSALGTYWKDRVKRYKTDVVKQFFLKIISIEISVNRLIKAFISIKAYFFLDTQNYIPSIFTSERYA